MQTHCNISDCSSLLYARGWCQKHYWRFLRHGSPTYEWTIADRFWSKVDKNGPIPDHAPHLGNCWLWKAFVAPDGYAKFWVTSYQRSIQAHRWSYEQINGSIPQELELDHLCRVRHCVRPEHLEAVSAQTNWRRGFSVSVLNARKTHCPRGHEYSLENTYYNRGSRHCRICLKARVGSARAAT